MTSGPIDVEEIADGLLAVAYNAEKLAADARRLFSVRRYSSALFLGVASLEESGKAYLLVITNAVQNTGIEVEWKEFWKNFRSHEAKQAMGSFLDLAFHGEDAAPLASLTFLFQQLHLLRSRAIYVDYVEGEWTLPKDTSPDWAREVVEAAQTVAAGLRAEFHPRRRHLVIEDLKQSQVPLTAEQLSPETESLLRGLGAMVERVQRAMGRLSLSPDTELT